MGFFVAKDFEVKKNHWVSSKNKYKLDTKMTESEYYSYCRKLRKENINFFHSGNYPFYVLRRIDKQYQASKNPFIYAGYYIENTAKTGFLSKIKEFLKSIF